MRAIVLLIAFATVAHADELAEARRLEAALEYEKALVIVERVIASGGATREQLVERHVFAGRLAAGLDREPVAEDHFARALALAPAIMFPDGTSPKIMRPLDAARARTVPLRVTGAVDRGVATITVEADPLALVAGMAVKLERAPELREPQGRRIELPDGARATELVALDAFGNQVWSQRVIATPEVLPPPITTPSTPIYKRPVLWGSLFVACSGVAIVGALQTKSAQDEWNDKHDGMHDYSELSAIEDRGKRWAITANIGFGLAAVTGVVTTWLLLRTQPSANTVTVTASGDAVGLAVAGDF